MKTKRVIEILEANGWVMRRMEGSHRQFHKAANPNVVTVAGPLNRDMDRGMLAKIRRDSGIEDIR